MAGTPATTANRWLMHRKRLMMEQLQFLDLFRPFRFGPILIVFFPGFAPERLEVRALRADHRLNFCYPLAVKSRASRR
jgi:hypothetical protein